VEHAIEEAPIVARWARPATPLRRQQRPDQFPLRIRQIPTAHDCSPKSSLESEPERFGNPFCQHDLVDGLFTAIADAAAKGEEIALNGFGKFKVKASPAREGRNPATGQTITIAASKKLTFTPAKAIKDRLNG